jgi:hypothetical protein
MGNPNAKTNPGAHRAFALLHDRRNLIPMLGFDSATVHKVIDEFVDCFPSIRSLQIGDDLLGVDDIGKIHTIDSRGSFRLNQQVISRANSESHRGSAGRSLLNYQIQREICRSTFPVSIQHKPSVEMMLT